MDDSIVFTQDARGLARITLNRPQVRNAFDDALIEALTALLKKIALDKSVRVLELRAKGKVFCAGADLAWMQRMANYSYEENRADADQLAEFMYTLNALPFPTMAVVQGAAYGGGMGLIACCDLAIASAQAEFCLSEVKLGLIPAVISPFVLARIGEKAMRRYALTAEVFGAVEAQSMGLIDEAVDIDILESRVAYFTDMLLKNSQEAMASMKNLLQDLREKKDLRKITVEAIAKCRVSEDAQARLKKFLMK